MLLIILLLFNIKIMKFIAESSRDFIDEGKIKTYTSPVVFPELAGLLSFQKKILLPKGKMRLKYENDVERIFIFLSGTAEILNASGRKKLMRSETILVLPQGMPASFLTSADSSDLEYLELVFSVDRTHYSRISNLVFYSRSSKINITAVLKSEKETLSRPSYWISLLTFNAEKEFSYKKSNPHNYLLVYLVAGEAAMNGLILNYNDTVLFTQEDGAVLGLFMKKTELLIVEIAADETK